MTAAYQPPLDLGSLKEYVKGTSRMQAAADSTVLLHIAHNHLKARFPEIRLDMHVSGKAPRLSEGGAPRPGCSGRRAASGCRRARV